MILVLVIWGALLEQTPGGELLHAEPVPLEKVIASLIEDLGAPRYDLRERATRSLRRIGRPALKALEAAAASDDPEVRTRAQEILKDVRLGISPDWPNDIILQVRHYENLNEYDRRNALQRITRSLRERSVPFVLSRLAAGSNDEARYALQYLKDIASEEVCRRVIELLDAPANNYQAQALAWAQARMGQAIEAIKALRDGRLDAATRNEVVEAGVKQIIQLLKEGEYEKAADGAAKFVTTAQGDARFRYLRAEALVALDKPEQARQLRDAALAMNPGAEAPHYTAGEMLQQIGRRRLAAKEWQKILAIGPVDDVYDINAHLRLGVIYDGSGLYRQAAEHMSRALELFVKAREAGRGVGMVGGTEESLRRQIDELYRKADRFPVGDDTAIEDELPENHINVQIQVTVKDGKAAELAKALEQVSATLTVNLEPWGFRLLDIAAVDVRYDAKKEQIGLFLRESRCCEPIALALKTPQADVAIKSLDCCYIFRIDAKTGQAEQIARFEKDYTVTFRPGLAVSGYRDVSIRINDVAHDWQKLQAGVEMDYLPPAMDIVLAGTKPSGKQVTSHFNVRVREPDVRRPAGPAQAAAESQPSTQPRPANEDR